MPEEFLGKYSLRLYGDGTCSETRPVNYHGYGAADRPTKCSPNKTYSAIIWHQNQVCNTDRLTQFHARIIFFEL